MSNKSPTTIIPCLLQFGKLRMAFEMLGLYHNMVDSISVLDLIRMSKFVPKLILGLFLRISHQVEQYNAIFETGAVVYFSKDLAIVEV